MEGRRWMSQRCINEVGTKRTAESMNHFVLFCFVQIRVYFQLCRGQYLMGERWQIRASSRTQQGTTLVVDETVAEGPV